jgi:hypothetical protein
MGEGSADSGAMTPYDTDLTKQLGSWKCPWTTAKKAAGVQCRNCKMTRRQQSAAERNPDIYPGALSGARVKRKLSAHQPRALLHALNADSALS